jgi:hypothetical protein
LTFGNLTISNCSFKQVNTIDLNSTNLSYSNLSVSGTININDGSQLKYSEIYKGIGPANKFGSSPQINLSGASAILRGNSILNFSDRIQIRSGAQMINNTISGSTSGQVIDINNGTL